MKHSKIKLIGASVLALAAIVGTSCGGSSDTATTTITFEFLEAGYGKTPYQHLAESYMAAHPDVKIKLKPNALIASDFPTRLSTGTNLPDVAIFATHNVTSQLYRWAKKGYLADMSDILTQEVENGQTVNDKLDDNAKVMGKYNDGFYFIPEYYNIAGYIYNADLFEAKGWATPTNMKEFNELCDKINGTTLAGGNTIKPIVYSGGANGADGYLYLGIDSWMTSYEGVSNMDTFYNFASAEVYNPTNSQGKIIGNTVLSETYYHSDYVLDKSLSMSAIEAQGKLFTWDAAMMLNGSWFENEMKDYITESTPNFKMFAVPEAVNDDGTVARSATYTNPKGSGSVLCADVSAAICVPSASKQQEVAKDFVKFMCREDVCVQYSIDTNAVRPINYTKDPSSSKYANMSDFGKSVMKIANDNYLYPGYSKADIYVCGKASLYPQGDYWYNKIRDNGTTYTPEYCITSDYNYAVDRWDAWVEYAQKNL